MGITSNLTPKQQFWFDHISRAKDLGLSLSLYAKQENINVKALYNYQTIFRKKGLLESERRFTQLVPTTIGRSIALSSTQVRVTLRNGVCVELPVSENGIDQLLRRVSQL